MSNASYTVLISANAEWQVVRAAYPYAVISTTPFGEQFETDIKTNGQAHSVRFVQGGWGKISAAASTQYAIEHFNPTLIINLGTCGSFDPSLKRGDIVLATHTIVYDIHEQMGDPQEALDFYSTTIDTEWTKTITSENTYYRPLISADRDIIQADIAGLRRTYPAAAADWESGAIAWTAARNTTPVLILRGVSDEVSSSEAHAYNNMPYFESGTMDVVSTLLNQLPHYLVAWANPIHSPDQVQP